MSSNPSASPDTLSASQQQLLASTQQLQDAQTTLMQRYTATTDEIERKKIVNEMDKNETLRSNLLASSGNIALVQNQAVAIKQNAATDATAMMKVMDAELKDARKRMEEIQTNRTEKERMIELNTYYGKRFMAQAGVMKIFIYMCIPVLILAVLANAGFLPNYIAGFMIIASIVIGIVYIYGAVQDINRRDAMNFDEYTWEFDPSRVGPLNQGGGKHKKKKNDSNADAAGTTGCSNGQCCAPPTKWDAKTNQCTFVNDAQGENAAVKGTSSHKAGKHGALLGDLASNAPTSTTNPTPTTTGGPITSNLCWTNTNRALKGQCMGNWKYDGATDTCTAPAGSVASSIKLCSPYKVSTMNAASSDGWTAFTTMCKVGGENDLPNCT
jgi:hypothetical protein